MFLVRVTNYLECISLGVLAMALETVTSQQLSTQQLAPKLGFGKVS